MDTLDTFPERIDSFYMWGTEGYLNLFFRPKGTFVQRKCWNNVIEEYTSSHDFYIIQWEGEVEFDSGLDKCSYFTLSEAKEAFEIRRREEDNQRKDLI